MRLGLLQRLILIAFIVFPLAMAEDQTEENVTAVQNMTFHNHSIYFEIPDGWETYSDTGEGYNSSTILTDGMATVRIDIIRLPEEKLNNIVSNHLKEYNSKPWQREKELVDVNVTWLKVYRNSPWQVAGALLDFYIDQIKKPDHIIMSGGSINLRSAGLTNFQEDCYVALSQNFHSGNTNDREKIPVSIYPAEMYVVWTKPGYNNTFVAIRADFPDMGYETFEMKYYEDYIYLWPKPLWDVIATLKIGLAPVAEA